MGRDMKAMTNGGYGKPKTRAKRPSLDDDKAWNSVGV